MIDGDSNDADSRARRARILAGLLALAAGLLVCALATGLIASPPEKLKAPHWVVLAAGATFVCAGLAMLGPQDKTSLIAALVAAVMVTLFASVACWVAFGSGTRNFEGAVGGGALLVSGKVSEWSGRIAFGFGAIVLSAMSAWAWWRVLTLLRQRLR